MIKIIMARGTVEGNIHLYSILAVFSAFGLGAFYYTILEKKWAKWFALGCCLLNGLYYLYINVIESGHAVFDSMAYVLLALSVVSLSLLFIIQLMRNVTDAPISKNLDFWFVASQLIYYTASFAIFLTYGYLTNKAMNGDGYRGFSTPLTWLWSIHNVLLFLSSLMVLAAVSWTYFRKRLQ